VSPLHAVAIFAAGIVAGTINTVVGSGTLFIFPVLLAFGYAPVVANVSNTVGLVPGSASGALGYRRELSGQGRRLAAPAGASVTGGVVGDARGVRRPHVRRLLGGVLGARVGRRLPPTALRVVIVVVGIMAIIRLLG
jgi:uncharacterized membrane protein YfcA